MLEKSGSIYDLKVIKERVRKPELLHSDGKRTQNGSLTIHYNPRCARVNNHDLFPGG